MGKDSFIQFSFPHIIIKAIRYPEIYAILNLSIIRNLEGKHSIALYECLKDYQKIGGIKLSIEKFRQLMGLAEEKYTVFTMLKKRVIEVAVQEVNEKTDILVNCQLLKEGRKVAFLHFKVKAQKASITQVNENFYLEEKLAYFGIKERQIKQLLKQHEPEYLWGNIKVLEQEIAKGKVIHSPARYLSSAFQKDYRPTTSPFEKEQKQQRATQHQKAQVAQEQKAKEQALHSDFLRLKTQRVIEAKQHLSAERLQTLQQQFEEKFAQSPLATLPPKGRERLKNIQWNTFLAQELLGQEERNFETYKKTHQI